MANKEEQTHKIYKGERTRKMILERAAPLFNQQGYSGVSLGDIMHATDLEKGGIYNHFANKEQLALDTFDYTSEIVKDHIAQVLAGKKQSVERLYAFASVFEELASGDLIAGGCPILNSAIESDDTNPVLRAHVRLVVDFWRSSLQHIIHKGIERQELRPDVDADTFATLFISTLEGAIMLTRLYDDLLYIQRAVAHIHTCIDAISIDDKA